MKKAAIVLVPEIALTTQTKRRFISRFGKIVSVLHSKMTILERQTEIRRIMQGETKIVIGPRSALFVPLNNIGLIVIDEEHDSSYISQTTPRYDTREVARYLCYMNKACLLLGSATPDVKTMYQAETGGINLYKLSKRPNGYNMPKIHVVNMKEERVLGNGKCISLSLLNEIKKNIQKKEQTFIFLNRRGFASSVVCRGCGKILKCANCDVGLTYHKKIDLLLCHYCSYAEKLNNTCPYCGSENLDLTGIGTELVEKQLHELLPEVTTIRMDADTTVKRGAHEEILDRFKKERIDVLIGTQMISKGHDIETVTLVGIINADSTYAMNTFSASEKGFSNLLQVSGRAGRGSLSGRVIVQAYDEESTVIDALKTQSYDDFYKTEIEFRKYATYPPFCDIVLFELTSMHKEAVQNDSKHMYDLLGKYNSEEFKVLTPKTPYISKINNKYSMQIIVKTQICDKVLNIIYKNLQEYDKIHNRDVYISVTKNPLFIG